MKIRLNPNRHCGGFIWNPSTANTSTTDARTAASEGSIGVGQHGAYFEGIRFSGRSGQPGINGGTQVDWNWLWIALAAVGVLLAFKFLFPKR